MMPEMTLFESVSAIRSGFGEMSELWRYLECAYRDAGVIAVNAICIEDICPCAYWGVITSSLDSEGFAKTATPRSEKIARFS